MQIETAIQKFIQGGTVNEQLEASKNVQELLHYKMLDMNKEHSSEDTKEVSMEEIVRYAIKTGISTEDVLKSDNVESKEKESFGREGVEK